jgi:alginate O-acetyltransferase complex protein AlgI
MLFTSVDFLIFLGITLGLYVCLGHRGQNRLLLAANYLFYGWFDWRFVGLLFLTTTLNFQLARVISRSTDESRRRRWLLVCVAANLSILGYFKYASFFAQSFATMLGAMGLNADYVTLNIVLPVGISFYTFQAMGYTIDVYRRQIEPTDNFWDFALFGSFFPLLAAGPIERASTFLPQVARPRTLSLDSFSRGIFLILFGLFQKIVIADGVTRTVDALYGTTGAVSWADLTFGTVLFAIQIYCDFAGYTDIARGVAKLFGFDLMKNFDVPYASSNPQEFWRRWHISLSSWLRDYLYIPLGGGRSGRLMTYRNLMITMVLGGLWHGAAWNYVLWGAYQGLLLCGYRAVFGSGVTPAVAGHGFIAVSRRMLSIAVFFVFTCYGWLLFRAESFTQIVQFTRILLFDFGDFTRNLPMPSFAAIPGIALLLILDACKFSTGEMQYYRRWPEPLRGAVFAAMLFLLAMGLGNRPAQFIYFQF